MTDTLFQLKRVTGNILIVSESSDYFIVNLITIRNNMEKQAYDSNGDHIGSFDGEFVLSNSGKLLFRVDGDEIYTTEIPCKYVGIYANDEAHKLNGSILFRTI